ncbi:DUF6912 family protein, partial [Mycobacterium tuberculosis]
PVVRRQALGDHLTADGLRLTQRYTIAAGETTAPVGPGVMMAGQLLVPVTGGIGRRDPITIDQVVAAYVDNAGAEPAVMAAIAVIDAADLGRWAA